MEVLKNLRGFIPIDIVVKDGIISNFSLRIGGIASDVMRIYHSRTLNSVDLKRIRKVMEVEDFILSNEDKLNEVDVGSKAPLVHDPLLNLKDSDDFGPNVVVSLSIDDIFSQEESLEADENSKVILQNSLSPKPTVGTNKVKLRSVIVFSLHYSHKTEALVILKCLDCNFDVLEDSCTRLLISSSRLIEPHNVVPKQDQSLHPVKYFKQLIISLLESDVQFIKGSPTLILLK